MGTRIIVMTAIRVIEKKVIPGVGIPCRQGGSLDKAVILDSHRGHR
jgi:hypothetical protein